MAIYTLAPGVIKEKFDRGVVCEVTGEGQELRGRGGGYLWVY